MNRFLRVGVLGASWRPGANDLTILVTALLIFFCIPAMARGSKKHTPLPATANSDPSYVSALALANRFLFAWQAGDLETGTLLLSDGVRHLQNPEKLETFFATGSDRSYEITHGTGNHGRYIFPVALVSSQSGKVRRRFSQIIVVNTGKNDWAIDRLP